MEQNNELKLFEDKKIRTKWNDEEERYRQKGYSEEWINQRLKTIDIRKEFTDELKSKGINSGKDFAILTNILTQGS